MTRKPLGRGLGALLSADQIAPEDSLEIDIDLIDPGAMQPRIRFDEAKLRDLAKSIESNGVVQPLLVRRQGSRYELIAGERRWRAARAAGLVKVPAVIRDVPDGQMLELALIENIQREDLNAIEEAHAYKKLIDTIGLTQDTLGERIGRDRSYITNYLRLLRLPLDIQRLIQEEKITPGHARTLLGTNDVDVQRGLAQRIVKHGLSVRDTERLVRGLSEVKTDRLGNVASHDPNVRAVETKLRRQLGAAVKIVVHPKSGRGAIEISFHSLDDLDRLYQLLTRVAAG